MNPAVHFTMRYGKVPSSLRNPDLSRLRRRLVCSLRSGDGDVVKGCRAQLRVGTAAHYKSNVSTARHR